jgi:hypothetical protein
MSRHTLKDDTLISDASHNTSVSDETPVTPSSANDNTSIRSFHLSLAKWNSNGKQFNTNKSNKMSVQKG